jgi:hypothetical protein
MRENGALSGDIFAGVSERSCRKRLSSSTAELGNMSAPFGTVALKMVLETEPPFRWDFIHPLALIYVLTEVSDKLPGVDVEHRSRPRA